MVPPPNQRAKGFLGGVWVKRRGLAALSVRQAPRPGGARSSPYRVYQQRTGLVVVLFVLVAAFVLARHNVVAEVHGQHPVGVEHAG